MEIKLKFFLLVFVLVLFSFELCAQEVLGFFAEESEEDEDFLEYNDDGNVENWQTLEWEEENPDYVYRYEINIESFDSVNQKWVPARKFFTVDSRTSVKIDPPLGVGKYRYRIIPYDFIEMPSAESEWVEFNILQAYKPSINSVSVNVNRRSVIYFDEYNDGFVTVSGKNLFDPPEGESDESFTKYYLLNKKTNRMIPLEPVEVKNKKEIVFCLDLKKIDVGDFNFYAVDASGLASSVDRRNLLELRYKKAFDLDISGGWFSPFIILDDTIPKYMGQRFWPEGGSVKLTFIPIKRYLGYYGFGLEAFYTRMNAEMKGYSITGNLSSMFLTAVYQKPVKLKNNWHLCTFEIHGGAGIEYFMNYQVHFKNDIDTEFLNSWNPAFIVGGAVQMYVLPRLYVEANLDFCMTYVPYDMIMGDIRPSILVGWQF